MIVFSPRECTILEQKKTRAIEKPLVKQTQCLAVNVPTEFFLEVSYCFKLGGVVY